MVAQLVERSLPPPEVRVWISSSAKFYLLIVHFKIQKRRKWRKRGREWPIFKKTLGGRTGQEWTMLCWWDNLIFLKKKMEPHSSRAFFTLWWGVGDWFNRFNHHILCLIKEKAIDQKEKSFKINQSLPPAQDEISHYDSIVPYRERYSSIQNEQWLILLDKNVLVIIHDQWGW